jgi:hypothetical protein
MVADELRRQSDQFIDLASIEQFICRDPSSRPMRPERSGGRRESYPRGAGEFEDQDDLPEEV